MSMTENGLKKLGCICAICYAILIKEEQGY